MGRRRLSGISLLLNGQFVSVCQTPFILTPDSKRRILQGESDLQKQHEVHKIVNAEPRLVRESRFSAVLNRRQARRRETSGSAV